MFAAIGMHIRQLAIFHDAENIDRKKITALQIILYDISV